jgi:hypothetical protein
VAYLQISLLGGSRDETWRGQGIRKRYVSWNLPKLSQLWQCNGGFRPLTTQNHLRTKQFVGGSVWYVVWNHRCTITIDSVLANSETHNAFLFPVHAMFRHDCPLAMKPASKPRRLRHKKKFFWEILYLLICSRSVWPSWLLYRRGQKSRRDLRITLYNASVSWSNFRQFTQLWYNRSDIKCEMWVCKVY